MRETAQKETRIEPTGRLAVLADLCRELTPCDDPASVLERTGRRLCDLVAAESALVVILSDDGSSMRHLKTILAGEARDDVVATLPSHELVTRLLEQPVFFSAANLDLSVLALSESFAPVRNSLCVPLRSSSRAHGWACMVNRVVGEEFNEFDAYLSLILASQAATAYEASLRLEGIQTSVSQLENEIAARKKAESELRQERHRLELKTDDLVAELSRTNAALRIEIEARTRLSDEREKLLSEVQEATGKLKVLSGVMPICATCKKVRDAYGGWQSIESYLKALSDAGFSHTICPVCEKKLYEELHQVRG